MDLRGLRTQRNKKRSSRAVAEASPQDLELVFQCRKLCSNRMLVDCRSCLCGRFDQEILHGVVQHASIHDQDMSIDLASISNGISLLNVIVSMYERQERRQFNVVPGEEAKILSHVYAEPRRI